MSIHWHRWHVGRYHCHWVLGGGDTTPWWRVRYKRHLRRTGFAFGPVLASLWRHVGNDPEDHVRRFRAGWWGRSSVMRVQQ